MGEYKENDKAKAICTYCDEKTDVTFLMREVSFALSPSKITILAGVCDECDNVIVIPKQVRPIK